MKNCFLWGVSRDLLLSRNRKIMLSVQRGHLTVKGMIETYPDSKTCSTTFQLQ